MIANDTTIPGVGIGKLITARAVAHVVAWHIDLNRETQAQPVSACLSKRASKRLRLRVEFSSCNPIRA